VEARVTVVLPITEFAEPFECARYGAQEPMFATRCVVTWTSPADWAGNHFSVKVLGARRKKNGDPYNEVLDKVIYSKEVEIWLERAGVTEATIADALSAEAAKIREVTP
jgi:hypothetical protein